MEKGKLCHPDACTGTQRPLVHTERHSEIPGMNKKALGDPGVSQRDTEVLQLNRQRHSGSRATQKCPGSALCHTESNWRSYSGTQRHSYP